MIKLKSTSIMSIFENYDVSRVMALLNLVAVLNTPICYYPRALQNSVISVRFHLDYKTVSFQVLLYVEEE